MKLQRLWHGKCEGIAYFLVGPMKVMHYWYFISNRATRQCIDLVADSPEAACREIGWQPNDCVVIAVGEMADGAGGPAEKTREMPAAAPADPRRH